MPVELQPFFVDEDVTVLYRMWKKERRQTVSQMLP
ncbi:hypothetical protein CLOBOL_01848 [Enterocloster bolteae ATCC BAA-613]|uniref:Uncharacterized protein n=1 Tax=Enterocloster bolteae (strain ATCC BAA-613 / DSM 15670 / CCUG 46953 / JCM 12243 / WAL 16351) TaxID=411902 RepID=A8RM91_ENTBW|nr:hypothetical protein CLOBOL_01848 [Enterocloster bolteae ATCC BAA-613]